MKKTIVMFLLVLVSTSIFSMEREEVDAVGTKLLEQLWEGFKNADMDAIENLIAKGFQSVHQNGANDFKEEMELITKLNIAEYKLTDIKITSEENVIIISYKVSVAETIEGKRLDKMAAPRLTVFAKTDNGWKWVAHANLKPLK